VVQYNLSFPQADPSARPLYPGADSTLTPGPIFRVRFCLPASAASQSREPDPKFLDEIPVESVLWARSRAGEARRSEPLTATAGPRQSSVAECRHGAAFGNGSKSPWMQNQLFEAALGIAKPWYVRGVDFDPARKVLTVGIDFVAGSRFAAPGVEGLHRVH
jgi:hypothetical protein